MNTGRYPRESTTQVTRFSLPYKLEETRVEHYCVDIQYLKHFSEPVTAFRKGDHLRHPPLGDGEARRAGNRDPGRALPTKNSP